MACNLHYPINIEKSSIQNTRLIGYFTKASMKLFELKVFDHKHQLQKSVRCISAHQPDVCYNLYEIADNDFTHCIKE